MEDFALGVLDRTPGYVLDFCKVHTSVQYIEYFQENDVFSFEIPVVYEYAQYLQEGDLLLFGYKGKARLMQVTYRSRNANMITISGEAAFPQRIAITATRSQANDGYDVQTANGETLVRYFIAASLTDPYGSAPRSANFAVFGEDQFRGGTTTYSSRY